jgi:hypothetical protein
LIVMGEELHRLNRLLSSSLLIDAGDPVMTSSCESEFSADRIVIGAFGRTPEAAAKAAPADLDDDGDVDASDLEHSERCASGPGVPQSGPGCQGAKLDDEEDVDQTDFSVFQRCLHGEMATREGVFLKPAFEQLVEIADLPRLPGGVARRDRRRAALLSAGTNGERISRCDWAGLTTEIGSFIHLPNPCSGMVTFGLPARPTDGML